VRARYWNLSIYLSIYLSTYHLSTCKQTHTHTHTHTNTHTHTHTHTHTYTHKHTDLSKGVQAGIWNSNSANVGFNGAEGVVGSLRRLRVGERIEQSTLAARVCTWRVICVYDVHEAVIAQSG